MSEYKIRSQKRSRQSYAPYHTKKSIVSRVWGWLAPSSWWSGGAAGEPPSPPSPSAAAAVPDDATDDTASSSAQATLMVAPPSGLLTLDSGLEQEQVECMMNGMDSGPGGMEQGPEDDSNSSWVAEDVADDPVQETGQTSFPDSRMELMMLPRIAEHSVDRVQNPMFGTTPGHALRPSLFSTGMRPAAVTSRVLHTRPLSTSTPQQSPVSNEAGDRGTPPSQEAIAHRHGNRDTRHGNRSSHHGNHTRLRTMQESVAGRLPSIPEQSPFHADPSMFHTTPSASIPSSRSQRYTDLSISHSPFQSPFYSGRTSFGGAASGQRLCSAKRARTGSSPPVLTPVQLTVTAKPRPSAPPPFPSSLPLSSTTARKILLTLDSLSSPLADARKLPLRAPTQTDKQPARKRHKSAQAALSPPPIAALSAPSLNSPHTLPRGPRPALGPVIVPNEKSIKRKKKEGSGQSSLLGVTMRPAGQMLGTATDPDRPTAAGSEGGAKGQRLAGTSAPGTAPSTSPALLFPSPLSRAAVSKLSSLTFTPPPLPAHSPSSVHSSQPVASSVHSSQPAASSDQPRMDSRRPQTFTPTFHATNPSPLATSGGKVRLPRSSRTHHSCCRDNAGQEEEEASMVPNVGLGLGGTAPSFSFASTVMSAKPASTLVVTATKTPPSYSFSTPTAVTSDPTLQAASKKLSTSFQFSAPNLCTPTKAPLATPPRQLVPPTHKQATPPEPEVRPLQSMSVVDVLKRPDYQALTAAKQPHPPITMATAKPPATMAIPKLSTSVQHNPSPAPHNPGPAPQPAGREQVVDLTDDAEEEKKEPATTNTLTQPTSDLTLSSCAALAGSWECGTCLVQNQPAKGKCVACGAGKPGADTRSTKQVTPDRPAPAIKAALPPLQPLAQFAPPKGSWECEVCMVSNTATDTKCVACATPKPGGGATSNLETKELSGKNVVKFGARGGLQLGSGGLQLDKAAPLLQLRSASGEGQGGLKLSGGLSMALFSQKQDVKKSLDSSEEAAPPPLKPLPQFAPAEGSWSCDTCMVSNKKDDSKCVACGSGKPGTVAGSNGTAASGSQVGPPPVVFGASGGIKLGAGGLKFGAGGLLGAAGQMGGEEAKEVPKLGGEGFKFGSGGFKFGAEGLKPTPSQTVKEQQQREVKQSSAPPMFPLLGQPAAGSWECGTCLVSNKPDASTCVACGGGRLGTQAAEKQTPFSAPSGGMKINFAAGQLGTPLGAKTELSAVSDSGTGTGLKLGGGLQAPRIMTSSANPLAGIKFGSPLPSQGQPAAPAKVGLPVAPFSLPSSAAHSEATKPMFQLSGGALSQTSLSSSAAPPSLFNSTAAPTLSFGGSTATSTGLSGGLSSGISSGISGGISGGLSGGFSFGTTTSQSRLSFATATSSTPQQQQLRQQQPVFKFGQSGQSSQASLSSVTTSNATFTFSGANPSTGQTSQSGFGALSATSQAGSAGFNLNFSQAGSSTAQTGQTGFNFAAAGNSVPTFSFSGGGQSSQSSESGSTGNSFSAGSTAQTGLSAAPFQFPASGQVGQPGSMFTAGTNARGRVIKRARRRKT